MIKYVVPALLMTLALTACQSPLVREDPQLVASPDRTDLMLADAADRATKALESLAAIEKAKSPGTGDAAIPNAPTELRRSITLSWNGPIEPVGRLLADRASYEFQIIGDAPPTALIVNIDVRDEPVINVLRSTGLQLGTRGTLKVDPNRRVIELEYAPVTTPNDPAALPANPIDRDVKRG